MEKKTIIDGKEVVGWITRGGKHIPIFDKEESDNKINELEKKIKDAGVEKTIIIDENGNIILEKSGDFSGVGFGTEEGKLMSGKILLHNHPNGAGLSFPDARMLNEVGLKEIRAIAPDGTYHSLSLASGSKYITDRRLLKDFESDFNDTMYEIQDTLDKNWTKARRRSVLNGLVWKKIAPKYGLKYKTGNI